MITFRQFMEAKQMMMFSTRPRELYHGTVSGKDDSNLRSFKTKGAVSGISGGYGQGRGFFVYSDKNSARKQAVGISTGAGTSYRSSKESGRPMVVTVQSIMEPEDWDLDYELNYKVVMDYLLRNFDAIKEKMQSDHVSVEKVTMGLRPWEKPDYYSYKKEKPHPLASGSSEDNDLQLEPMENWMPRDVTDRLEKRPLGLRIRAKGSRPLSTQTGPARSREVWHRGDDQEKSGYTTDGETVGMIMDMLQKNDPKTVHSFEEMFFSNMGPGIAVKYVGSKPLAVKEVEVAATDGNMLMNQAVDDSYWRSA